MDVQVFYLKNDEKLTSCNVFLLKAWALPDEVVDGFGVSSDHGPLRIMTPFFHASYNRQKRFEKKIFEDPKHISSSTRLLVIYL